MTWDPAAPFTTSFSATEDPISERGIWIVDGTARVVTASGRAFGTSSGGGVFAGDSRARLNRSFGPDQSVSAVIAKSASTQSFQEIELHLRTAQGTGYEVFLEQGGAYLACAKWNNAVGPSPVEGVDYNIIQGGGGSVATPNNGDVLSATIVGNTITASINGVQIWALDIRTDQHGVTISTWKTGGVGIGFDGPGSGGFNDSLYGLDSFTAVSL